MRLLDNDKEYIDNIVETSHWGFRPLFVEVIFNFIFGKSVIKAIICLD